VGLRDAGHEGWTPETFLLKVNEQVQQLAEAQGIDKATTAQMKLTLNEVIAVRLYTGKSILEAHAMIESSLEAHALIESSLEAHALIESSLEAHTLIQIYTNSDRCLVTFCLWILTTRSRRLSRTWLTTACSSNHTCILIAEGTTALVSAGPGRPIIVPPHILARCTLDGCSFVLWVSMLQAYAPSATIVLDPCKY
jgi:hypothetical protein